MRLTKRIFGDYDIPNDPDGASIRIKHLKANEVKKINSKVSETYYETNDAGDTVARVRVDQYTLLKAMAHAALVDWSGFKNDMGKELEFIPANVVKSAEFEVLVKVDGKDLVYDFYGWIDKCRNELSKQVADEKKVAEEN